MKEHAEFINLIDLGKTVRRTNSQNENRSFETLDSIRQPFNKKLIVNLEHSELFSDKTSEMNDDEQFHEIQNDIHDQLNSDQNNGLNNLLNTGLNNQNSESNNEFNSKIRRSFIKNKLKKLSINNSVSNSRNNYEKLTDSLLIKTDQSKYYGSFSKAKQCETTFSNLTHSPTVILDDDRSIAASVTSQNLLSVYLKEFEQEKHLNLLGFKTILIVILSFCFLISLIYTFTVYYDLTDEYLKNFNDKTTGLADKRSNTYYRMSWIFNSIISLIVLIIGIIGLLKEKVILILITSVCMMLTLIESDDTTNGRKNFNISLFVILSTSVLLIIFAARLR